MNCGQQKKARGASFDVARSLFDVSAIEVRGKAPSVYLAQSVGLGTEMPKRSQGPKARPLIYTASRYVNKGRAFSPGWVIGLKTQPCGLG